MVCASLQFSMPSSVQCAFFIHGFETCEFDPRQTLTHVRRASLFLLNTNGRGFWSHPGGGLRSGEAVCGLPKSQKASGDLRNVFSVCVFVKTGVHFWGLARLHTDSLGLRIPPRCNIWRSSDHPHLLIKLSLDFSIYGESGIQRYQGLTV